MRLRAGLSVLLWCLLASLATATAEFVEHVPGNSVFVASNQTMREPLVPREDEGGTTIWTRIGYSFFYTDVCIYYTTDGSVPSGSKGVPAGSTQVLRSSAGQITFQGNEFSGSGNIDWWKGTLPAQSYGTRLRYRIGAWHSGGGPEVFGNNYGCSDGVCNDPAGTPLTQEFTVKLAWPGKGSPAPDHQVGYPNTHFWKEEAVAGNNYINTMLDQNGALYDIYFPSAGAVQGVATKNEGYVGGLDTFPPGLPLGNRGQMNLNTLMAGLRFDGKTYWLSNEAGSDYVDHTQSYVSASNTVITSGRLVAAGNNINVQQIDFAPKGISFPNMTSGQPNRGIHIKRLILTNNSGSNKSLNVYVYGDFAINGGDQFDGMFVDSPRGAMVAYDNTYRLAGNVGEYNPSSFSNYEKNVSLYFGAAMKQLSAVGGSGGTYSSDSWRDSSGDNGQGWIGLKVTLPAGGQKEIDVIVAGGFERPAGATNTYADQIAPVMDWFQNSNMATIQNTTDAYWQNWLEQGTTVDFPDDEYDELMRRSLLATALHLDGKGGGVVAGMHNGAYPYVWPRDAVYAAITLARTGHFFESSEVYRFLREVAFRASESWGKGFFYQKYSTDGYIIWSAPQVDETAAVPWGVWNYFRTTGDTAFLNQNYVMAYDAARASSEDSSLDSRLYFDDTFKLMHSMNVWEDQFNLHLYSNANVHRGLKDAAAIATELGHVSDASLFNARATDILSGIRGRLAWNGENTDISLLGLIYPFEVISPTDPDAVKIIDRINGVATDNSGNNRPLMNFSGEFQGLVNRYWGDTYWNGGPWYLSTLWYGLYYADRADYTVGTGDIDNHKLRMDLLMDRVGPIGFGAEQIAPNNSLLYPTQTDFALQAAWPNAWESMSTLADSIMAFLDYSPDAKNNVLRISPKLPRAWNQMKFQNVRLGSHQFDVMVKTIPNGEVHTLTNKTGNSCAISTWVKMPRGATLSRVTINGVGVRAITDRVANRVQVNAPLATGVNAQTEIRVTWFGALDRR